VIRAAIRQLNDKDVRQRRRAVRKLFELDNPVAIDAFIPLLDDDDEWFREKALIAIQKWASMKDLELTQRLANSKKTEERILASRIAPRIGKSCESILKRLADDENNLVKQNAWKIRLEQDKMCIKEAILVKESGVRILAIENMTDIKDIDEEIMKIILRDNSKRVRKKAVSLLKKRPELNASGQYDEIMIDIAENDKNIQIDAMITLIESGRQSDIIKEKIPIWIEQKNPQITKAVIEYVKEKDLRDMDYLIEAIINSSNDKLVSGFLRRNNSAQANKFRKEILVDGKKSSILRARVIEDLFGKTQDEELMGIIQELQESKNKSIANSAKMFIKSLENYS